MFNCNVMKIKMIWHNRSHKYIDQEVDIKRIMEAVFSSTGTYFSVNPLFQPSETSFLSTVNIIFLFQPFSANGKYY